ncbi:MAG: ABC-2 family transporter protein [Candidatus Hydrogenedentes bacterium]|nr:ABC-2 family transporter protein [Candidatus Hydrogenedentota bacterium]
MQYRASLFMMSMGQMLFVAIDFAGMWALFARFGSVRGWRLPEVALFYGLVRTAFPFAEAFGRGFDVFSGLVKGGGFDRLLLRPRSAALQVAGAEVTLFRVGRLAQGLVVLIWSANALGIDWTLGRISLVVLTVIGGACFFFALLVLQATLAFWTTETLEIMNAVTYGGTETGKYPLTIYHPWFRKFFTFVIPLACVSYFPALTILGRADQALGSPRWFQCLSPLIGVLFLAASLQVWKFGVRHYRSTGS